MALELILHVFRCCFWGIYTWVCLWHTDIGVFDFSASEFHLWCMKYNPLCISQDQYRIDHACASSRVVQVCWGWVPTSVRINLFLTTFDRQRFWLTCSVLLFDSQETAFWLTEYHSQVRVTDWEVPSPPLQAWEVPPEHQADESSGAGSDGGNDE